MGLEASVLIEAGSPIKRRGLLNAGISRSVFYIINAGKFYGNW